MANGTLLALAGKNVVDQTYSLNAAHAHLLAADRLSPTHPKHKLVAGKAFFVSNGEPRPISDHWRKLWTAATDLPLPSAKPQVDQTSVLLVLYLQDFFSLLKGENISRKKKFQFFCSTRWYDITQARNALDYEPLVSLDEGIRRTAEVECFDAESVFIWLILFHSASGGSRSGSKLVRTKRRQSLGKCLLQTAVRRTLNSQRRVLSFEDSRAYHHFITFYDIL